MLVAKTASKQIMYNKKDSEERDLDMEDLKKQILELTRKYYEENHANKKVIPGVDKINYGGRYYGPEEMENLVSASLDFWLTSGEWTDKFEKNLADYLGVKFCAFCNSGSSANLIAFNALTSPLLKDRRINKGDEVITVACGFPTTITPIIQYGAIPVFVDMKIPEYNIDENKIEEAISNKTKAIMLAHSLGNPYNLKKIKELCEKYSLWLVEDNCDALGSEYTIDGVTKKTGTWGDIGTSSFYPPHHMTTGEGGAVYTNNPLLYRIIKSYRDWGRDCWCNSGKDNSCGCRFTKQFGELPIGYDHKYVYSHFGYNLKATDLQAAIGCAQLEKLDYIVSRRRENFSRLKERLQGLEDYLILPKAEENSDPSWFGFLITVKNEVSRTELTKYLEDNKIQTRNLFAGNIVYHPCFDELRSNKQGYRISGELTNTDHIMNNTFWIGVYPGMTNEMIDYMASKIKEFLEVKR